MFRVERNQLFVVSQFKLKCCLTYYIVDENQPQCFATKKKDLKHCKTYKKLYKWKENKSFFIFKDGINYRKL